MKDREAVRVHTLLLLGEAFLRLVQPRGLERFQLLLIEYPYGRCLMLNNHLSFIKIIILPFQDVLTDLLFRRMRLGQRFLGGYRVPKRPAVMDLHRQLFIVRC